MPSTCARTSKLSSVCTFRRSRIAVASGTPAASCPGERTRPSIIAVVAGLPRSWHTAPSMIVASRARSRSSFRWRASSITISVWIQTSPSGCHSAILRAVVERHHLRQDLLDHAEVAGEREANRRPPGLEQQLLELAPNAFGRQIVEAEWRGRCRRWRDRSSARTARQTAARAARAASRRQRWPDRRPAAGAGRDRPGRQKDPGTRRSADPSRSR